MSAEILNQRTRANARGTALAYFAKNIAAARCGRFLDQRIWEYRAEP